MSGSLIETMMYGEWQVNRSCAVGVTWVAAVIALICLVGLTGAFGISYRWMYLYAGVVIPPIAAVVVHARLRDYRGSEIKYMLIAAVSLVPAAMSVPTLLGFFLMPLPIVVAGRYFSRRIVWESYLMVLALTFAMTFPHVRFGVPCYPLCDEAMESLRLFLDGEFSRFRYWRYLVVHCYPSFALCLLFFAITMSRLCRSHLDSLECQARTNARLADVEKGLAIAAAMEVMSVGEQSATASVRPLPRTVAASATAPAQPDVRDWSTQAISDCIAKVKRRAADDPAFAALVERDPAAAVREVQI